MTIDFHFTSTWFRLSAQNLVGKWPEWANDINVQILSKTWTIYFVDFWNFDKVMPNFISKISNFAKKVKIELSRFFVNFRKNVKVSNFGFKSKEKFWSFDKKFEKRFWSTFCGVLKFQKLTKYQFNWLAGQAVTRMSLEREVWVQILEPVKYDTVLPRLSIAATFLRKELCYPGPMTRRWAPQIRYALRRKTASIIKDLIWSKLNSNLNFLTKFENLLMVNLAKISKIDKKSI